MTRVHLLALALALPTAQVAQADDSRIFTSSTSAFSASKTTQFAINEKLGRAWVELDKYYAISETSDHHKIAVPGLSFDRERSEVVFDAHGQRMVCATVAQRGWWLFAHKHIEPTGNCALTHRYVNVPIDNGFAIENIEHFEVHFKPVPGKESNAS